MKMWFIILLFLLSLNMVFAEEEKVIIRQDIFYGIQGQPLDIYIDFTNIKSSIYDLNFSFKLKPPFILDESTDIYNMTTFRSGEKLTLHYKLNIDKEVTPGDYQIEFRIYETPKTYYKKIIDIKIKEVSTNFDLKINYYNQDSILLDIYNIGINPAQEVSINLPEQEKLELTGQKEFYIGKINSGDHSTIKIPIKLNKDVVNNTRSFLNININYKDTIGNYRDINKETPIILKPSVQMNLGNLTGNFLRIQYKEEEYGIPSAYLYGGLVIIIILYIAHKYHKRKTKKSKKHKIKYQNF